MGRIASENTGLVLRVFSALQSVGLRFSKNVKDLPGSPHAIFKGAKVAVFIESGFWHGWQFDRWKDTITEELQAKILKTRKRRMSDQGRMRFDGWRVLRLWDHQFAKNPLACATKVRRIVRERQKAKS